MLIDDKTCHELDESLGILLAHAPDDFGTFGLEARRELCHEVLA
jgi:hypothetical protein